MENIQVKTHSHNLTLTHSLIHTHSLTYTLTHPKNTHTHTHTPLLLTVSHVRLVRWRPIHSGLHYNRDSEHAPLNGSGGPWGSRAPGLIGNRGTETRIQRDGDLTGQILCAQLPFCTSSTPLLSTPLFLPPKRRAECHTHGEEVYCVW